MSGFCQGHACGEDDERRGILPRWRDPLVSPVLEKGEILLAKKMQELSFEEREQALHDLHGVADHVEETDELITEKLEELDAEIEKFLGAALNRAMKKCRNSVLKTRLMFLRSTRFDAARAADRMVRFFELKRQLFGEENLAKDITWHDLSDANKQGLENGSIQLSRKRDRAGRAVVFRIGSLLFDESTETRLRLLYFMVMKALEDEEIQKRGMVWVAYHVGISVYKPQIKVIPTLRAMPVRIVASHFCYDATLLQPLLNLAGVAMAKHDACRFRVHFGSHLECQYTLLTFGMSREMIPVSASGELKLAFHTELVKQIKNEPHRPIKKSANANRANKKIVVPGHLDVLLGRGRHGVTSPGNCRFRDILESHRQSYDTAGYTQRKDINQKVLQELKAAGTRFIKKDDHGWSEISDEMAIGKISHAFRNLRKHVNSSNVNKRKNNKRERPDSDSD